jgi:predicted transcriptional regulator
VRSSMASNTTIEQVIFCCFSTEDLQIYKRLLAESPA